MATTDRLLRIDPETRTIEILVDNAFWVDFYPNSMVVSRSGTIYLGMRYGVAEIKKSGQTYTTRWLLPNWESARMIPWIGFR